MLDLSFQQPFDGNYRNPTALLFFLKKMDQSVKSYDHLVTAHFRQSFRFLGKIYVKILRLWSDRESLYSVLLHVSGIFGTWESCIAGTKKFSSLWFRHQKSRKLNSKVENDSKMGIKLFEPLSDFHQIENYVILPLKLEKIAPPPFFLNIKIFENLGFKNANFPQEFT